MNSFIPLLAQTGYELTAGGWTVMLLSVGFVTSLLLWCVSRVLRESSTAKIHDPRELDTGDLNET
jgi:hypothetical protein